MTRHNYDTHVRARAALARKVADRRRTEGMNQLARPSICWALGKLPDVEALLPAAYEAIAAYKWPEGWGTKYSRFRIFGKPMFVDGQTKDIPARVVHGIMAGMPDLPQFTVGVRTLQVAKPEPETTAAPEEDEYDFDAAVEEARAHLHAKTLEMHDADDGLLATPCGDRTIDCRRRASLDAAYRVEEAEVALEKALREQSLYGRGSEAKAS